MYTDFLSRALFSFLLATTLVACGSHHDDPAGNSGGSGVAAYAAQAEAPQMPAGFAVSYAEKSANFTWQPVPGASAYAVFQDPDGSGPLPSVPIGTVTSTAFAHELGLPPTWINVTYAVQACNSAGCSTPSTPVTLDAPLVFATMTAADPSYGGQRYGGRVALSKDGRTLAVASPGETSGAPGVNGDMFDHTTLNEGSVYVYVRSGTGWRQQAFIKTSVARRFQSFGLTMALSDDGDTLAVGAPGEDSNATGINGNPADWSTRSAGAVLVFRRAAGAWSQEAYLKSSATREFDRFGVDLSISGDGNTLAASAAQSGLHVFTRNSATWSQQAVIAHPVGLTSLAVSSDGSTIALGDVSAESLLIFTRSGGSWSQQAVLLANSPLGGTELGFSIAISADGNTVAAGARREQGGSTGVNGNEADASAGNSGAVYVFARSGTSWNRQAYLKAGDRDTTRSMKLFGVAISLSGDGSTLVVGAPGSYNGDDVVGLDGAGEAYLFRRAAGNWLQLAHMTAPMRSALEQFGASVSISGDGRSLAIGGPGAADVGMVYAY